MNNTKLLFNDCEYQLGNQCKASDDIYVGDPTTMYMIEAGKYPLLTAETEYRYGRLLQNPENRKLLTIKNIDSFVTTILNLELLFYSLCDNNDYEMIVNSLIVFFDRLNSNNDKTIVVLQKYLKATKLVNRPLNKDELNNIFNMNSNVNSLNKKELIYEIRKFMNYKFAYDKLYVSNLRLVISVAKKYCRPPYELNELISEGNMGLLKAVQKFDISKNCKFSTYAVRWIESYVKNYMYDSYSVVKLPYDTARDIFLFKYKEDKLNKENGRLLSQEEIAEKLQMSVDKVKMYNTILQGTLYLDREIKDIDKHQLKDIIPDTKNVEEEYFKKSLSEDIKLLFKPLTKKETQVIEMYYNLDKYDSTRHTHYTIADEMDVTKQRIVQLRKTALRKMKEYGNGNKEMHFLRDSVK